MKKEKYVLLNLKTYGVKCLDEPIEIQFTNKTIDDSYGNKSLIKAIYGTNGEGKTAIAHTLDIYKRTILNTNYLRGESYVGGFKELINHRVEKVYIDLYFARIINSKTENVFHHVIEYVLNDKDLTISHELLSIVVGQAWGNGKNEQVIFETKNGEFVYLNERISRLKDNIDKETKNLLTYASAVMPLMVFGTQFEAAKKNTLLDKELSFFYPVLNALLFAISINVYIDKRDQHYESYDRVFSLLDKFDKITKDKNNAVEQKILIDNEIDEIDIKNYEDYEKEVKRVCEFIKVFKPNLKTIKIDKTVNRDKYYCKKILVYNDGKKDIEVSSEFESSGVKKLITLFPYLNAVENGEIVFIDEFDSNIHDVYLCKLIEYFISFAKGQLIFTTHNLGPMELLDEYKMKHSIDFINGKKITSWKKNGNYSVVNLYRNGMIPNSPFNISSVDFVKVFGGDK
ncbi:MAG: ATP-binding protein [Bacilli bacterium]|nr:ATP-binding protein [Bacilli bacterium]